MTKLRDAIAVAEAAAVSGEAIPMHVVILDLARATADDIDDLRRELHQAIDQAARG